MNYLYILYLSHFDVEIQNQLLKTENAENGPPAPRAATNPRKKQSRLHVPKNRLRQ